MRRTWRPSPERERCLQLYKTKLAKCAFDGFFDYTEISQFHQTLFNCYHCLVLFSARWLASQLGRWMVWVQNHHGFLRHYLRSSCYTTIVVRGNDRYWLFGEQYCPPSIVFALLGVIINNSFNFSLQETTFPDQFQVPIKQIQPTIKRLRSKFLCT